MSVTDVFNYVVFNNPVSKTLLKPLIGATTTSAPAAVQVIREEIPLWEMSAQAGPFVRLAGVVGASAVVLGAYGSHKNYPKDRVKELKSIYEVANKFHFFSALALLGVPLAKHPRVSGSLFIIGTGLFAGPCYYHAFTGENKFGRVAPIGGTILIIAWLSLVL